MTEQPTCPQCWAERTHDYGKSQGYACGSRQSATGWQEGRVCKDRQIAALTAKLKAVTKQRDALLAACSGALVVMNAYFEKDGRDPYNNDNYCRVCDAIALAQPQVDEQENADD